jgi:hypothetical protein
LLSPCGASAAVARRARSLDPSPDDLAVVLMRSPLARRCCRTTRKYRSPSAAIARVVVEVRPRERHVKRPFAVEIATGDFAFTAPLIGRCTVALGGLLARHAVRSLLACLIRDPIGLGRPHVPWHLIGFHLT